MRQVWLLFGLIMIWPVAIQGAVETGLLEALLQQGADYQADSPREPLARIEVLMRQLPGTPEAASAYEACFLQSLKQGGSLAWQDFLCRQLSRVGGVASVAPMIKRLGDPKTANMARFVLERLDSDRVNPALRDVLIEVKGEVRIGVINTLGARGDTEAVKRLAPLLSDTSTDLAEASVTALGKIGSPDAIASLTNALDQADPDRQHRLYEALLVAAEVRAEQGDRETALAVYQQLAQCPEVPLQRAALIGRVQLSPDQEAALIIAALQQPALQETAMRLTAQQRDGEGVTQIARQLRKLPAAQQMQLLQALAATGQSACLSQVIALLAGAEGPVKIAALQTVGALGGAQAVELLANIAAGDTDTEQEAARAALYGLRGPAVDERIVALLPQTPSKIQWELVLAVEQRRIKTAAPSLMRLTEGSDRRVQRAALSALAEVAGPAQISPLVHIMVEQQSRTALEALVKTAQRLGQTEQVTEQLVQVAPAKSDIAVQTLIFQALSRLGHDRGLVTLQKATDAQDEKLQTVAIRTLAQWPTPVAQPVLLAIARSPRPLTQRVLALRGYVDMAVMKGQDQPMAAIQDLTEAVAVAQRDEEKRYVLGALPRCACAAGLDLARDLETNVTLKDEAQMAQVKICVVLPEKQRKLAQRTLERIAQKGDNESVKRAAIQGLRDLK